MSCRDQALACELPSRHGLPFARWSVAELRQEAVACGIVAQISGTTLWRWLGQDALRPWRHRSWIFPRDPHFARKAGCVIVLYRRRWKGARWGRAIMCSASMRRPPSRRGGANIRPYPQRQRAPSTLSTSMCVPVRWLTLPCGTLRRGFPLLCCASGFMEADGTARMESITAMTRGA